MTFSRIQRLGATILVLLIPCTAVLAQSDDESDPLRFWRWTVQDTRSAIRGFPSYRTLYVAGGTGGLMLSTMPYDQRLSDRAVDWTRQAPSLSVRIIDELGNVKMIRPLALMLFLGSLKSDNHRFQNAAFTSLEAIVSSNLITNALKLVVGRARPYQQRGAEHFRPFSGNTSFPSGHATTVFAFTTPWLLYYPHYLTAGLFVLGTGTAFTRLGKRQHWFTDAFVGSVIGFTTAYWLAYRHQKQPKRVLLAPEMRSQQMGLRVHVRF